MPDKRKSFMIEDAEIPKRNFSGKEGPYNREGDRNFLVTIPEELVLQFKRDGWNVRYLKPRDESEDPKPILSVVVSFKRMPPRIVLITDKGRTQLDEDTVDVLDWVDIKTVDLIANGSEWTVNGKTGVKAYLKSLFVTINEDALERKYAIYDDE